MASKAAMQVVDTIQSGGTRFRRVLANTAYTPATGETIIGVIVETAGTIVFQPLDPIGTDDVSFPSGLLATGMQHPLPMTSLKASTAVLWLIISTV